MSDDTNTSVIGGRVPPATAIVLGLAKHTMIRLTLGIANGTAVGSRLTTGSTRNSPLSVREFTRPESPDPSNKAFAAVAVPAAPRLVMHWETTVPVAKVVACAPMVASLVFPATKARTLAVSISLGDFAL